MYQRGDKAEHEADGSTVIMPLTNQARCASLRECSMVGLSHCMNDSGVHDVIIAFRHSSTPMQERPTYGTGHRIGSSRQSRSDEVDRHMDYCAIAACAMIAPHKVMRWLCRDSSLPLRSPHCATCRSSQAVMPNCMQVAL